MGAADASSDETLRDVGIDKAKGLIATLASDADNLFLILSAKALNSRLRLAARVDDEASEQKMRRAGADLADVQALLGHKSPKTTARYAEVSVDKLVTAVQRMERGWNEARGSSAWVAPQVAAKKAASD